MGKPWVIFGFLVLVCSLSRLGAAEPEERINLLSVQEGTLPTVSPSNYGGWLPVNLLDESSNSGWACGQGQIRNNVFVFEMIRPAQIDEFVFDTASIDTEGSAAKNILVEISDDRAKTGFIPVLIATLANKQDEQRFKAQKSLTGRMVRLSIQSNYGSEEYVELFSFKGFGLRPACTDKINNISGTYETSYSLFHVRQQGTALIGCYEYNDGLLDGSIDGRLMKFIWTEGENRGPAVMVFSQDGKGFRGYWWREGSEKEAPSGDWEGKKTSDTVGGCPHWSGSVGGELKKQLSSEGRAKVYGILFDLNSATIRSESKPVLDEMVALLKTEGSWKLIIEGHTDDSGKAEFNQSLSEKRAESVKAYLVSAGISADRLNCKGFGQSKPVADNATELGRSQNRRVELVKVQ